jgi:hypothetical protein
MNKQFDSFDFSKVWMGPPLFSPNSFYILKFWNYNFEIHKFFMKLCNNFVGPLALGSQPKLRQGKMKHAKNKVRQQINLDITGEWKMMHL